MTKVMIRKFSDTHFFLWAAILIAIMTASPVHAMGDKQKGAVLAQDWCNSCHTVTTDGSDRKFDAGPRFVDLAKKDKDYLKTAINRPHDFMPKFPRLSDDNKADLIAYIRSLN